MSAPKLKPVPVRTHRGPHAISTKLEMIKEQIESCLHVYETEPELDSAASEIADRLAILPAMIDTMFEDISFNHDAGVEIVRCHEVD